MGAPTADKQPMSRRAGVARRDEQADGGELESWIADLAGGETSVRRLRQRLDALGDATDGGCAVCERAERDHASHSGHLPVQRTA
jgi:hypothetical protein